MALPCVPCTCSWLGAALEPSSGKAVLDLNTPSCCVGMGWGFMNSLGWL